MDLNVTQYDYCGGGAPTTITRGLGASALTTQFTYDTAGRLTNTVCADGYQVGRTFDDLGLLISDFRPLIFLKHFALLALEFRIALG